VNIEIRLRGGVNDMQYGQTAAPSTGETSIVVWDLGVRLFHWSLIVYVGICVYVYTGFLAPRNLLNVHLLGLAKISSMQCHRSQAGVSIEPFVECSRPVRGCGGDDGGRRSGRRPGTIFLANLLARGVPIEPINPVYTHECGSCHVAYPPSLAPAEMWTVVMDGLSDHFGESASLDLGTAAKLRDWLVANASERWTLRQPICSVA
jgi:hypothetical protein